MRPFVRFATLSVSVALALVACTAADTSGPASPSPNVVLTGPRGLPSIGPDTTPPVAPVGNAVVRGTIHDFASGADSGRYGAIAGAAVRIIRMDSLGTKIGTEAATVSDANGDFLFASLPPRTFFLELSKAGYNTSEYVISTRQPLLVVKGIMTRASP